MKSPYSMFTFMKAHGGWQSTKPFVKIISYLIQEKLSSLSGKELSTIRYYNVPISISAQIVKNIIADYHSTSINALLLRTE